jgi:hypothetical protein
MSMADGVPEIDVEFDDRRKGQNVTVRVVPLKWVLWIVSVLFILWNVVGFPLLDYYLSIRLDRHNGDPDAHAKIANIMRDTLGRGDDRIITKIDDVSQRLSRIEGALGIKGKQ